MNSPTEPGSPSPSTPSSGTPPPDEPQYIPTAPSSSQTREAPTAPKRRLPAGASFAAASTMRDAKTRRREEGGSRRGGGGAAWEGKEGGRRGDKEELVDGQLVDYLRKQFGDPFNEEMIKANS
ncbi:hypothetical protein PLICRDRAFT_174197 [Plicaturopsis crispa FD-325 SS-3]|nr:hypothetical protein PLICRDRAFT_174197 [Plicaturopsis crispa FD-325 SS-3]